MRNTDAIDDRLLSLLRLDSRSPLKVLAAEVGLSISAVQERIARLERNGIIGAYTIRLGVETAHAGYMLVVTDARQCAEVAPRISHIEEIIRCDSVAGDIDMVLVIEARSPARLQEIRDEIAGIEGVRSVTTLPRLAERFSR